MDFWDLLFQFRLFPGLHPSLFSGMTSCAKLMFFGLYWPYILTAYFMSVMTTYLTGVWELTITDSAAILNLYSGIVVIMPAFIKLVGDICRVSFCMLLLSKVAFLAGFVALTMSTPPAFSWATGSSCSSYEAKCVGQVQKNLFYLALSLLALATASQDSSLDLLPPPSLPEPPIDQPIIDGDKEENTFEIGKIVILTLVFAIAAVIAIAYISPWSIKFGMGTLCTVVSTIVFFNGVCSYKRLRAYHRPSHLFEVFAEQHLIVTLRLYIPYFSAYILLGIISSIGNTYFIEQATDLNHHVGSLYVPVVFLPIFKELGTLISLCLCSPPVRNPFAGIVKALIVGTLCCITAAKMETRRLGIVESMGFVDNTTDTIAMSMFLLVPQFVLLGLTESITRQSISDLFACHPRGERQNNDDEATKESKSKYKANIAQASEGVGIICGVLSVYVVRKIKPSWFQDTLNKSRLDNYYWTLSVMSAASVPLFIASLHLFYWCCSRWDPPRE